MSHGGADEEEEAEDLGDTWSDEEDVSPIDVLVATVVHRPPARPPSQTLTKAQGSLPFPS